MFRFEVDPGQLAAVASQHADIAQHFETVGSAAARTGAATSSAAQIGQVGGAIDDATAAWSQGLAMLARFTQGLSSDMSAAAEAYRVADDSAVPPIE